MKGVSYTWEGLKQGALKRTLRIASTRQAGDPTNTKWGSWQFFVFYTRGRWRVDMDSKDTGINFIGRHSFHELKLALAYARGLVQRVEAARRLSGEMFSDVLRYTMAADALRELAG